MYGRVLLPHLEMKYFIIMSYYLTIMSYYLIIMS